MVNVGECWRERKRGGGGGERGGGEGEGGGGKERGGEGGGGGMGGDGGRRGCHVLLEPASSRPPPPCVTPDPALVPSPSAWRLTLHTPALSAPRRDRGQGVHGHWAGTMRYRGARSAAAAALTARPVGAHVRP